MSRQPLALISCVMATYSRRRFSPSDAKLNLGIEAARGEIIQRLDDDDFYTPKFLATSIAHLPKPGLGTVGTRC